MFTFIKNAYCEEIIINAIYLIKSPSTLKF